LREFRELEIYYIFNNLFNASLLKIIVSNISYVIGGPLIIFSTSFQR